MNPISQVSRPMQVALVATLVLVAVWFGFLKKSATGEDVAAAPVTPAVTQTAAASTPGKTNSALDKTAYAEVQVAKDAAAKASADAGKTSAQTGEGGSADNSARAAASPSSSSASKASATKSVAAKTPDAAATPAPAPSADASAPKAAAPASTTPAVPRAQRRADRVILNIKKDLAARKAVVVLVWSPTGTEDKLLHQRITKQIDLRRGKVKTYFITVAEVGRYDGLLSGLSLGQTPSTIVIAPNNEAKVLGGLTSTARIDRLTSAATLIKPAATTPGTAAKP